MTKEITQGSIITNLRSQKYKKTRCYGIVISARCDLAQSKIDCVHLISALPLSVWIETAIFQKALSSEIRTQLRKIEKWAQSVEQDIDSLIELGPEKAILNIQASEESVLRIEAIEACTLWDKYVKYQSNRVTISEVASFLNDKGKSTRINMLKDLFAGRLNNYCFVPHCAYLTNDKVCDGLVTDFKDIISLSYKQIQDIQRGDYDYLRILGTPQLEELNQQFYLETSKDVVENKYEITSPWIERLMQNFAFSFIRVGVNTITKTEGEKLSKQVLKENGDALIWEPEENL